MGKIEDLTINQIKFYLTYYGTDFEPCEISSVLILSSIKLAAPPVSEPVMNILFH